jgi:hypothetical protein
MKGLRFFFLAILVGGSAAVVRADGLPVDPGMDVSDPLCTSSSCPGSVGAGQGFTFKVGANGGGVFSGTNQSGPNNTWNSLLLTFVPPNPISPSLINCTSGAAGHAPYFSPCQISTEDNGTMDLFYNNFCEGTCPGGIVPNDIFTINLNDRAGGIFLPTGSWPVGLDFFGYPNTSPGRETPPPNGFVPLAPVPEPGTITLLGVGVAALLAKGRLQKP